MQSAEFKKYVTGKRVAVVGPADYLKYLGPDHGEKIDEYDIVVRVNCVFNLDSKYSEIIGKRTDILYNTLLDDVKNGGLINVNQYLESNMSWICTKPDSTVDGFATRTGRSIKSSTNEKLKSLFNSGINYRCIHHDSFNQTSKEIGCRPTMGFIALVDLMSCMPAELYVTGFNFYLSGVLEGYWGGDSGIQKKYGVSEAEEAERAFKSTRHIHKNMWEYTKKWLFPIHEFNSDKILTSVLEMNHYSREEYKDIIRRHQESC